MKTQIESEEKKILELIVDTSEEFLQSAGREINYQKITDSILDISGAKYAVFTIFDDIEKKFRTIAASAPESILKKVSSLLGYKLQGKTWDFDPVLDERTKSNTITHFSSLQDLSGSLTPRPIIALIEKTFNTGEVILIKILKEDAMIGDFRLIMSKNAHFKNDDYVKLYTRQVGLLITRSRSEGKLIESETRLRSVFAAVNDPLFIVDQKTGDILDVNDSACRLYGYTRDEMLKLKSIDMSAEPEKTVEAMKKPGHLIPVRYHKKKDGTVFIVEISASLFEINGRSVLATSMRDITERKKSEELLKKERERFANILEGTNVGTWEWNVQTGETVFNERWAEIIGYSLEEISPVNIGTWTRFAHPEDLAKSDEQLNKVFAGEINYYDIECRMRHKEGNWIWVQDRGKVISRTPDGKPLWMSGTHTDITERKRGQEAVQKSEEKFSMAFHSGPVLMAISTVEEGYYIDVNDAFLKTLGFKREEVIGKRSTDLNMFVNNGQREEIKKEFIKNGRVSNAEVLVNGHDGLVHTGIFTVEPINLEGKPCWLTTMTDITDRKHAEVALRESEEKFRELVQMLPEIVFETDMQGNLTFANQHAYEMFGYSRQDFEHGINALDMLIAGDRQRGQKGIESLLKGYNSGPGEYTAQRIDGSTFPILISSSVVIRQGRTVGLRGLIFNISEQKKAEAEIIHLSFHDYLTGLYNRRFFEEELKRLDTERQLPLSLIMGDLNSLKIINDVFGHAEGDRLLKEASEILKTVCRCDDILARWGGDEFVILLPKTSVSDSEEIVERIKKECGKMASQKIPLSLSIGVATKNEAKQDMLTILIDAESNMYKNKLVEKQSLTSSVIFALEQALYEKSNETKEHTDRIHDFALKLGKSIKLSSSQLDELSLLASLHDIGKVAIPEKTLLKKGKLTEKEWSVIKRHPEIGFNIAQSSPRIAHIAKSILSCHENWDGSGYPMGLKGQEIPIISRIILIVDAYDVMTSGRAYKPAMSKEDAVAELKRCADTQFDPVLVDKAIEILSK